MGECITYRTMTAFSFIGGVFWLLSAILVSSSGIGDFDEV